jgi:hypothetical protein
MCGAEYLKQGPSVPRTEFDGCVPREPCMEAAPGYRTSATRPNSALISNGGTWLRGMGRLIFAA